MLDYTEKNERLGDRYYKQINRSLTKLGIAVIIVIAVLTLIYIYQAWLNKNAETKAQKMLEVKRVIAEDTHIKSFHAEIVYEN